MSFSEFSLYYLTCPDEISAQKISEALLNQKLIACSNILPGMTSQYWWQGRLERAQEVVLILKGKSAHKTDIEKQVLALHPYENPCFIQIDIKDGSQSYLNWLRSI